LILIADGKHLLTDVYTSALVLVGLAAVEFTGIYRIDGVIACIAGINIVFSGFKLVRHAFLGLMDASDPDLLEEICRILIRHKRNTWIDVHKLRAWRSGNRVHVDFHLILPRNIPLEESHKEVKDLEKIFEDHFHGPTEILIHLDPCTDPECPICALDRCDSRSIEKSCDIDWKRGNLVNDSALRLAACPDVVENNQPKGGSVE
jgi:cation diffusion facilitator family transporter